MRVDKIIIINGERHGKVELSLSSSSTQITGSNNRGKTSILNALQFLFVVDLRKMKLEHSPKKTVKFYFPNAEQSYMVFEGFHNKQGYFYLLLKRKKDKIEYYYGSKKFEMSFLINNGVVNPFNEVKLNHFINGISLTPFQNIDQVLAAVFGKESGKNDNKLSFLKLQDKTMSPRKFSKLYSNFFLNAGADNDLLKEGILISSGKENTNVDYSNEDCDQLKSWKKSKRELEKIIPLQTKEESIREYSAKHETEKDNFFSSLRRLYLYTSFYEDFKTKREALILRKSNLSKDYEKCILDKNNLHNESIGKKNDIKHLMSNIEDLNAEIESIEAYDSKAWLEQALKNFNETLFKKTKILNEISNVENLNTLSNELDRTKNKIKSIDNQIRNNEDLLIHNVGQNKEDKEKLNAIFSNEVIQLHKSKIINNNKDSIDMSSLNIGGLTVDLSAIAPKKITTIKELKEEESVLKRRSDELEETLAAAQKKKELENEIKNLEAEIFKIRRQLEKQEELPALKRSFHLKNEEISALEEFCKTAEKELERKKEKERVAAQQLALLKEKSALYENIILALENCTTYLNNYDKNIYQDVNSKRVEIEDEEKYLKALNNQFEDTKRAKEKASEARAIYEDIINSIRREVKGFEGYDIADNKKFLEWLSNQTSSIERKKIQIKELGTAVVSIFKKQNEQLLDALDDIKRVVKNEINHKISKYQISNLENVKLHIVENREYTDMLKHAVQGKTNLIDLMEETFTSNDSDANLLHEFIRKESKLDIKDLFTIETSYEINGKSASDGQSNGTTKIIKVFILLIFLRAMIHKDFTIPFAIDELSDIDLTNQTELFVFLKENNMHPISASPILSPLIDKAYRLETNSKGKTLLNQNTIDYKEKVSKTRLDNNTLFKKVGADYE